MATPSLLRLSLVFQVAALLAVGSVLIPTSPARAFDDSAVLKKRAVPLDVPKEDKPTEATKDEKSKADTDKLMEVAEPVVRARHLDSADNHSLYVLVISLGVTVISFPVVWVLATLAG